MSEPSVEKQVQFLTKLADLVDEFNVEISYRPFLHGISIVIDKQEVFTGWIESFDDNNPPTSTHELRKKISELTSKIVVPVQRETN